MKLSPKQIEQLQNQVAGLEELEAIFKFATEVTVSGVVKVPKERLDELEAAERLLFALQGAGVDNWQGYPLALEALEDEEDAD